MASQERLIDVSIHREADRRAMVVGACAAFVLCLFPGVLEATRKQEPGMGTDGGPTVVDEADNYAWGTERKFLDYLLGVPRAVVVFWKYIIGLFGR